MAVFSPTTKATASESPATAGTTTGSRRRSVNRLGGGAVAVIAATRARRSAGAEGVSARRAVARSGDKLGPHFLFETLERP